MEPNATDYLERLDQERKGLKEEMYGSAKSETD